MRSILQLIRVKYQLPVVDIRNCVQSAPEASRFKTYWPIDILIGPTENLAGLQL